jgi:hypothetical protein
MLNSYQFDQSLRLKGPLGEILKVAPDNGRYVSMYGSAALALYGAVYQCGFDFVPEDIDIVATEKQCEAIRKIIENRGGTKEHFAHLYSAQHAKNVTKYNVDIEILQPIRMKVGFLDVCMSDNPSKTIAMCDLDIGRLSFHVENGKKVFSSHLTSAEMCKREMRIMVSEAEHNYYNRCRVEKYYARGFVLANSRVSDVWPDLFPSTLYTKKEIKDWGMYLLMAVRAAQMPSTPREVLPCIDLTPYCVPEEVAKMENYIHNL